MGELAAHRRRIEVDGKTAVVAELGDAGAPRVVVIAASMLVRDKSYRPLLHEFARQNYRVIVVEMPGCGYASPVKFPWSMDDYARWLALFLPALKLNTRPVLIGHSNSGPPAALLAAARPDLIAALVLCDVTGADERFSLWPMLVGRAIDAAIEWKLTLTGFHHVVFNLLFHFRNCFNQIRLAAKSDMRDAARRIETPTLIAWGERDHTCPVRCGQLIESLVRDAHRHVLPHGSHDWLITHPAAFVEVLTDYLDSLDMRGGAHRSHRDRAPP